MSEHVEGRIALRFKNETDAISAAMTFGAALSHLPVEVVSVDLVQVQVAETDQQP